MGNLKKKVDVLEHALAANASAFYHINLTRNLVPGTMYRVIDGRKYSFNERLGLPQNAKFTDVTTFWGEKLEEPEKTAFYEFLSIPNLIKRYQNGEEHVSYRCWTKSAHLEPMLVELHLMMYTDDETGDILAINYVLNLTQTYWEERYKEQLEANQKRLESALEESRKASEYDKLQATISAVDEVMKNTALLDGVTTEEELNRILPVLLGSLGRYAKAERAYLFELLPQEPWTLEATCEWCAEGIKAKFAPKQQIELNHLPNWKIRLMRGETILLTDWEKEDSPQERAYLGGRGVQSMMFIPLISGKTIKGYVGFENQDKSKSDIALRMLKTIGGHIGSLWENLHMMAKLEEKQRSLQEGLKELSREKKIMDALSIDYTCVYYCDLQENRMIAIKQEKETNAFLTDQNLTQGHQDYAFRIQYYYDHYVVKESAPDFLQKMSAAFLRDYLSSHERFAYRFQTVPNPAGKQFFEVQMVRLTNMDGFKMVMGYRYIDDIVAEQEKQKKKLADALANATLNSEIIDSISKLYWLIYRVDVITGTFEEISAGQEMHRLTGKRGDFTEAFKDAREAIVVPEHQENMRAFLNIKTLPERLKDTESVSQEYRAASGSWHLARFIVKKRDADGKVTNVLYVVRLIDKQKQQELDFRQRLLKSAEEAKRANIAKTDFLRRMSHDIRTPINGIRGMISIANHYPDDMQKQKECRDKVMRASGFLLDLVNGVLDMNRLESGAVTLEHKPFDLDEVLNETLSILDMQAQEYAISIRMESRNIQHTHLIGSPLHFRQVFQNVASNAIKYNRAGGHIVLTCDELTSDENHAVIRLTCTDNGRGMSKEFLQKAFEPFSQEDRGARTSFTGTGLGLTITKQLIELMGGTVDIQSELGKGTRVSMTIPFAIDWAFTQHQAEEESAPDVSLKGVRVLLVEDNDLNMEIAKFMLEKVGMNVTCAWNGQEAVELFEISEPNTYEVILMDVMMPIMDGLEATRTIRAMKRADAQTIPIFAMTANAFPEDVQSSREAGMNEHLSKPLQEAEILKAIARYIRRG